MAYDGLQIWLHWDGVQMKRFLVATRSALEQNEQTKRRKRTKRHKGSRLARRAFLLGNAFGAMATDEQIVSRASTTLLDARFKASKILWRACEVAPHNKNSPDWLILSVLAPRSTINLWAVVSSRVVCRVWWEACRLQCALQLVQNKIVRNGVAFVQPAFLERGSKPQWGYTDKTSASLQNERRLRNDHILTHSGCNELLIYLNGKYSTLSIQPSVAFLW